MHWRSTWTNISTTNVRFFTDIANDECFDPDFDCSALVVDPVTNTTKSKMVSLALSMDLLGEDTDGESVTYLNLNSNPENILDTVEPLDLCCPKHEPITNLTEWIRK